MGSKRAAALALSGSGRGRRDELLECFRAARRQRRQDISQGPLSLGGRELDAPRSCPETDDKPAAVGDESDRAVLYPSIYRDFLGVVDGIPL